jgi:hypothetical protein
LSSTERKHGGIDSRWTKHRIQKWKKAMLELLMSTISNYHIGGHNNESDYIMSLRRASWMWIYSYSLHLEDNYL